MRSHKPGTITKPKAPSVYCDICGESCQRDEEHGTDSVEYGQLSAVWGYFSDKDLTRHEIDLCEKCFDKAIEFLRSIRTKNPYVLTLGGSKLDPLDGFEYGPQS